MPDPLAIGAMLGGLFSSLPAPRSKPRIGGQGNLSSLPSHPARGHCQWTG